MSTQIILSSSLKNLILDLSNSSPCCKMVQRALDRISVCKKTRLLNPELIGNYFTLRENEGQITYMPRGREQQFSDSGSWKREGRQGMKPAKWLRSILNPRLSKRINDSLFADFATKFKAEETAGKMSFEFVSFSEAYRRDNFKPGITSCMWDEDISPFYECFPCRALVCEDGRGKYHGRAIVWDKVSGLDTPLMDRVYSTSPEIEELFFQYAASNGITRKRGQNASCFSQFISPDGSELYKSSDSLRVTPDSRLSSVDFWPYLDTFRSMIESGEIFNSGNEDGASYLLDHTDGERTEIDQNEGKTLCADGEWYDEDECVYVGSEYHHQDSDDIVVCNRSDEYILRSDAYCVEMGGRIGTIYIHEDYVGRA